MDYYIQKEIKFKVFLEIKKDLKNNSFKTVEVLVNILSNFKSMGHSFDNFYFQSFYTPYIDYIINKIQIKKRKQYTMYH